MMYPTNYKCCHRLIPVLLFILFQGCSSGAGKPGEGDLIQPGKTEIFETWDEHFSWKDLVHQPELMHPAESYHVNKADDYFWLRCPVTNTGDPSVKMAVRFSQLTFVDYFLCSGDSLINSGKVGKFRPFSDIKPGDTRFMFSMFLPAGKPLTLWIKVHHTKKYIPQFDFYMQPEAVMLREALIKQRVDLWLQGALMLLFLYTLLSFVASRFRPYLWLMVFIAGIGMYVLSMGGYFVDWFFPEHPETGWLFNIHFGHLGLFGILMLVLTFWQLKTKSPEMYAWGMIILKGLVLASIASFCLNYYFSDYRFMNRLNLIAFLAPFTYIVLTSISVWRELNRAQRFLGFGILLVATGGLSFIILSLLFKEHSILMMSYISALVIILVSLIFTIGLKEELSLLALEKQQVLEKLERVQRTNNVVLEKKVKERTGQLERSNQSLMEQRKELTEKNEKIVLLINELNHRVKNNLQLLYSLSSMQLPNIEDEQSRIFMEGNMSRIKAMMVVNKQLFNIENHKSSNAKDFINEFCRHISGIYKNGQTVKIEVNTSPYIRLDPDYTLAFGLIITELLTNSFKHAFSDQPLPGIYIALMYTMDRKEIIFSYADNGSGMDLNAERRPSMGLSLIKDLALQLEAGVEVSNNPGVQYIIKFPAQSVYQASRL